MNIHYPMNLSADFESIDDIDHRLWHRLQHLQMLNSRYMRMGSAGRFSRGRDRSRGQGRVLQALMFTSDISQKDLAQLLDMRQQSLAELLAKLEAKGLITREQDPDDRRRQLIRLSDEGRTAAEEMQPAEEDQGDFALFDCLSNEEKEQLDVLLARITEGLETNMHKHFEHPLSARSGRHNHYGQSRHRCRDIAGERPSRNRKHHTSTGHGTSDENMRFGESFQKGHRRRGAAAEDSIGGPHLKHQLQRSVILEEESIGVGDAGSICDHNCRQCPLRATTSCVKRR